MKVFVSFILFFAFLADLGGAGDIKPTIIGGEEATPGEFPFVVGIYLEEQFLICSGVLIRENLVLTSASCTHQIDLDFHLTVVAGIHDKTQINATNSNIQKSAINGVVTFDNWSSNTTYHHPGDIGLVHLAKNFTLTDKVKKISLPTRSDHLQIGDSGTVVGLGRTNISDVRSDADKLRKVEVQLQDNQTCARSYSEYKGFDPNLQFCAGEKDKDSCSDSGGPFLLKRNGNFLLYGLISWGGICDLRKITVGSIYTRLPPHLDWIEAEMRKQPPPPPPPTTTTTKGPTEATTAGAGNNTQTKFSFIVLLVSLLSKTLMHY